MNYKGRVHRFNDNVNTDDIIAGKYKHKTMDLDELSIHLMENIRPDFNKIVKSGDFIVAGENFGCGSSREQAPQIIKQVGITAVLAKSFARIFFRNAINIGLLVIPCDTDKINDSDILYYDASKQKIFVEGKDFHIDTPAFPDEILGIIKSGGLLEYALNGGFL